MSITFTRIDPTGADRAELIEFLTSNEFPFHMRPRPTRAQAEAAIDDGDYRDDDHDSYWIDHSECGRVGFFRVEDMSDPTPLFDIRLAERWRGRGLGVAVLKAATALIFEMKPDITRFEGQTREDNIAMRKTFLACGWVKEAHYREAWPVSGGDPVASVGYGILRRDWESGTQTPVPWGD